MDELQTVDCFERLCGHLLRHAPDIQKRVDLLQSSSLSSQNLTFFLSHLIALLSKIDDQSAEGKRRIRRYIIELGAGEPEDVAKGHLMVREQGGVWGKPLSEVRKKQLEASFRNLKDLSGNPEHTGAVLTKALAQQEHLPGRVRLSPPSPSESHIAQYLPIHEPPGNAGACAGCGMPAFFVPSGLYFANRQYSHRAVGDLPRRRENRRKHQSSG